MTQTHAEIVMLRTLWEHSGDQNRADEAYLGIYPRLADPRIPSDTVRSYHLIMFQPYVSNAVLLPEK